MLSEKRYLDPPLETISTVRTGMEYMDQNKKNFHKKD